ncbi:low molecular weight protein-tyrosine-phosphatase [Roseateles sp. DB2]|uniref:low molecular weight protein-tyrosine-phosphatase n=1 Tax=Roseateles sp. DB2 TaxID=3453717 RepID=UPI003EEA90B4
MVCTGNICRSPTAEGVLQHHLRALGLEALVHVDSAGIQGWHADEAPDPRSQAHASRRGYDLSTQRARAVQALDFEHADIILAMDRGHLRELQQRCPAAQRHKLGLLLDHAPGLKGQDVPDPYYGGSDAFEEVLDLVEAACGPLAHSLSLRLSCAC